MKTIPKSELKECGKCGGHARVETTKGKKYCIYCQVELKEKKIKVKNYKHKGKIFDEYM